MIQVCRKNTWPGSLFLYGLLAAISLVVYPYGQAQADIGGIGSPYYTREITVENSPSIAAKQAADSETQEYPVARTSYTEELPAKDPQIGDDAVMIIRFNRKKVYFHNELKKVVNTVSDVRPEAVYAVQSIIPSSKKSYGSDREGTENLKQVVRELSRVGVPIERVKTNVTYSDAVRVPEIRIFIQ